MGRAALLADALKTEQKLQVGNSRSGRSFLDMYSSVGDGRSSMYWKRFNVRRCSGSLVSHRNFEDADAPRELQKINKFGEFAPLTYAHSLTAPVELPTSPRTHACPIGPLLFHAGKFVNILQLHAPAHRVQQWLS
jgi:hypothetical protein